MNRIKFFMLTSLVSKFLVVSVLYFTVFKASIIAGILLMLGHVAYELSEFLIEKEIHRQGEKAVQQLYEKLTMGSGGGHC